MNDDHIELDLSARHAASPEIDLDVANWRQSHVVDTFGLVDTGVTQVAISPTVQLPTREAFGVAKLAQELGYSDTLTVGALEDGIRFYQQHAAEACLELGKRLLLLKEVSPHGEFGRRVELLGFSQRSARCFMSTARKFTKTAESAVLASRVGTHQKLLELLVLDDSSIDDLASGGEASGITLDEIECMTATELRKQLRHYKDSTLPDEKARPLNDKIASLEKQLENHEKVYEKQQAELEDKDRKLKQLTKSKQPGKEAFSVETMAVREEAHALEYGAGVYIKALGALLKKNLAQSAPTPEEEGLRYDAIANAVSGMYLDIDTLFQELQALRGTDAVPPELSGKHVLTEIEKQRLADCKAMIDHDFAVKTAGREDRRAEDNKKAPGRPEGAKNKPK